jgi:hypothetical protein
MRIQNILQLLAVVSNVYSPFSLAPIYMKSVYFTEVIRQRQPQSQSNLAGSG